MTVSDRILVMNQGTIEQSGVPTEVYEHPITGSWHSSWGGQSDQCERVKRGEDALGTLRCGIRPLGERNAGDPAGTRARGEGNPANNGVYAEVRELIFRGDHLSVCRTGASAAEVPPGVQLRVGQKVWLELPLEHLEVLLD